MEELTKARFKLNEALILAVSGYESRQKLMEIIDSFALALERWASSEQYLQKSKKEPEYGL